MLRLDQQQAFFDFAFFQALLNQRSHIGTAHRNIEPQFFTVALHEVFSFIVTGLSPKVLLSPGL
jgi:hypothetical protein